MEITLRPQYKQHLAYEALKDPSVDVIFIGGGAGGGKSWLICESRLVNAIMHPGYKSYIGREELKRLMQSTYLTWNKVCQFHKIPQGLWKLNGQYNYIEFTNGSRIDLLDLKFLPADPLYERFGSLEYTDGAIEEAGEINFLAYDTLKTRIGRHRNKELGIHPTTLISGNPKKNWTYQDFYKPFKNHTLPKNQVFIQSLYTDNEYTAEEYGKQLSQIKDKATKERLMFGNWEYDDDPAKLIEYDAIVDLFTNTVEPGNKYLTADIARFGQDKTVIYLWEGLKVYKIITYAGQDTQTTRERIKEYARDEKIPYSRIAIDEDGVGGGVVDGLPGVRGFIANASPLPNPITLQDDNYQNLKTQCTYILADRINNHQIAVETDDVQVKALLTEELEQIKSKDMDKDGKKKIVGKDEIKENIGRSPDYADALMMRMLFELKETGLVAKQFVPSNMDRVPTFKIERPEARQAKQYIPRRY